MRSAFDKLISGAGLVLAAVLLIGGGLMTWANVYIGNQVDDQLSMQGITMPEGDALAALRRPTRPRSRSSPAARSTPDRRPGPTPTTTSSRT